jgi:hypothetical protein
MAVIVTIPFVAGTFVGWSPGPIWSILLLVVSVANLIRYLVIDPIIEGPQIVIPALITAAVWLLLGLLHGRTARRYLLAVGPGAELFTVGTSMLGVGLGQIVYALIAALVGQALGHAARIDARQMFTHYGIASLVAVGILLLVLLDRRTRERYGLRSVLKVFWRRLLALLTVWGIVFFVIDQIIEARIIDLTWRIPGIEAPALYEPVFVYVLGILAGYPLLRFGSKAAADEPAVGIFGGLSAAIARYDEGYAFLEEGNPLLTRLVPFEITAPDGWLSSRPQINERQYYRTFAPPGDWPAILRMMVSQYTLDTPPDHALFRRATYVNVTARSGFIEREACGAIHGQPCYEAWYRFSRRSGLASARWHGYVLTFVAGGCEFTFVWESLDPNVYQHLQPTIRRMIEGMQIGVEEKVAA